MCTLCHREVLLKEPLRACQAEERGNFNMMFPCSLALGGDSRNIDSRIKLLLSSPAVKGQFMHIFSSLEGFFIYRWHLACGAQNYTTLPRNHDPVTQDDLQNMLGAASQWNYFLPTSRLRRKLHLFMTG